MHPRTRRAS